MQKFHKKRPSDGVLIIRIFVSFFFIVLSVFAIYTVIMKVLEIKILEKINIKPDVHDSINFTTDNNTGNPFVTTPDHRLQFRKEDGTFAREEWIEKNAELFYFDTAGYGISGDLKKEGQVYTFENGKLKNIKRDTSYVDRADDNLYSSVKSSEYLVWLEESEKEKSYYPIKYSLINEDETDYLGTEADKQYASPNMVKIYMSNIYYLALGKGGDFAGRLYRMRPHAIHKETVGVGVTGFIVLSDDVVYYCDGDTVMKAKNWRGVELQLPENEELTEDGEIVIKIPTSSVIPLIDENNNMSSVNVDSLPVPDIDKTKTTNATISNVNTINQNQDNFVNQPPIEQVIPIIGDSPVENKNDQVAPQVIEVEAPH